MCHQSVGLVQRAIEAEGITTISMTMLPEITRKVGVPRALAVRLPLGHPFGMPGQRFLQAQLIRLMLSHAGTMSIPGEIVNTGLGDENAPACEACGTP